MSRIITLGGRSDVPTAPYEIADEVERWARTHDRSARLHFFPTVLSNGRAVAGTWVVRLSLKPNDKRMELFRQGLAPEPPTEDVWLHRAPTDAEVRAGARPDSFIPLDIYQMGASGVREFLEKGDTWSGRGEYASITDELRLKREHNEKVKARAKEEAREANRLERRDERRQRLGIPFLTVGKDLK